MTVKRSVAVFDLGGVLIDWNPRYLYRKLFDGDDQAMEHFLATVCTPSWNAEQDAGRTLAEACALLSSMHPDKSPLIDAWRHRYAEMLGGPKAPGIGFAMGLDRLVLTLEAQAGAVPVLLADAYIAPLGEGLNAVALVLARELRRHGLRIEVGDGSFRIKKSFETGNKLARNIVLLGEDEAQSGMLTVKNFASGEQTKVAREQLAAALAPPHE